MQRRKAVEVGDARHLTLGEYRELLDGVPMPSPDQLGAFAHFVPRAHSWYKGPLLPPGHPMLLFLYPGARAQRVNFGPDGRLHQIGSLEQGFLKTSQPTDERFGHAAYDSRNDTLFLIRLDGSAAGARGGQTPVYRPGPVPFDPDRDELVLLPDEVREAGRAEVSGLMHPRACLVVLWVHRFRLGKLERGKLVWPAESGGAAAFAGILDRVQTLSLDPLLAERPPDGTPDGHDIEGGGDYVLYRLLTPERERQQRLIVAALGRVTSLVR